MNKIKFGLFSKKLRKFACGGLGITICLRLYPALFFKTLYQIHCLLSYLYSIYHLIFRYKRLFSKRSGHWSVVPVCEKTTYPYHAELQNNAINPSIEDPTPLKRTTELAQDDPRCVKANIVPIAPESTATLASKQRSRNNKSPSH